MQSLRDRTEHAELGLMERFPSEREQVLAGEGRTVPSAVQGNRTGCPCFKWLSPESQPVQSGGP